MANKKKRRTLLAYAIHGHTPTGPINYENLFRFISEMPYESRQLTTGARVTLLSEISNATDDVFIMRVVTGFADNDQTIFDIHTGNERDIDKSDSEIIPTSVIVGVNVKTRAVAVERRRPGVPIATIERLLSALGRELLGNRLVVSLTPVTSESFLEEIEKFERIRRAEVRLARPNFDWLSEADALISELGDSSDADSVDVAATAKRGKSLNFNSGIVRDIKELARHPIGALKNAKLIGTQNNSVGDTSLSLDKHQQRTEVLVSGSATDEALIREGVSKYVEQLELRAPDQGK